MLSIICILPVIFIIDMLEPLLYFLRQSIYFILFSMAQIRTITDISDKGETISRHLRVGQGITPTLVDISIDILVGYRYSGYGDVVSIEVMILTLIVPIKYMKQPM